MKLPDNYMYETMSPETISSVDERRYQTLKGLSDWLNDIYKKPTEIEMTESQFWNFTYLQPLHAGEERYWTTFHGIPIRCSEMTEDQQRRLRIHISSSYIM